MLNVVWVKNKETINNSIPIAIMSAKKYRIVKK